MNKKISKWSRMSILVGAVALQGCAHSAQEKRLDAKVSQETEVNSKADLQAEASDLIESAPTLSADQRSRLRELRDSTRARLDDLSSNSLKLRAVLIKDLISTQYDEREVELIKSKIRKLENERINTIFGSVEKANKILGHEAMVNQGIMHNLIDFEPRGSGKH